ncbi:MAG: CBS domain-containing protein [Candidatus Thermoplasmatota archaeon]
MKVKDIMSKDLIVGHVPGKIEDALEILAQHNVSGIPILKKDTKKVAGVLTRSDIFKNPDETQLALVMKKDFQYIKPDDEIKKAAKLFYEHRIHGLPVINDKDELVGIISPTEILKQLSEKEDDTVEKYYTNRAAPVYEETPINVAMEIINITHQNALPVIGEDLKLSGIVTDGDVFKLGKVKEGIESSNLGMGDDEDQWTWEGIRDTIRLYHATSEIKFPKIPVKKIMVKDVLKALRTTPVCETAKKMVKKDISQIPIVNDNKRLIGMITDIDLMPCLY